MSRECFIQWGWLHRPCNAGGVIVTITALAFMLQVFAAADTHSHSVSDTLYAVYPYWGVTFLGWDWIARRTSRDANR